MKKLMFAAAALVAGLAMADGGIASANIVGYMGKQLTLEGGTKLISASFQSIGETGIRMSELSPKGYETNEDMLSAEGTWGDFVISFLNEGGEEIAAYSWYQECPGGIWEAGYWNEDSNESGESFDVIPTGWSMFFASPTPGEGESYTLMNAGQVVTAQVSVLLPEGTCQVGNPRATNLSLDEIIPTGYLNNQDMISAEGTWGDFVISFLNEGGEEIAAYSWYQECPGGVWETGYWNEDSNDGSVTGTLAPGDGFFVAGPARYGEDLYYITIPAMSL